MSALLREAAGLARQASYWPEPAKAKGPIRFGSLSWLQTTKAIRSTPLARFRGSIASAARERLESHRSRSWVLTTTASQMDVEALLFGYFLLGQQEKVTAGGARPAGSHASQQGGQP